MTTHPTVVLVHGALTDASVWNGVITRLQADGITVLAPAMPLRGLASDAAYLAALIETVEGRVVLAGHSYGGSVISDPTVSASGRVAVLAYASAFQPDSGESTGELNGRWPGSLLGADTTVVRQSPLGEELYLRPEAFADVYAADVAPTVAAAMAAAQRPIVPGALGESFDGKPTWSTIPSFTLVSGSDRSLPPAAMRAMAERAGSHVVEVDASHASPVSRPDAVAALVRDAVGDAR